jgi:hypothetical protein
VYDNYVKLQDDLHLPRVGRYTGSMQSFNSYGYYGSSVLCDSRNMCGVAASNSGWNISTGGSTRRDYAIPVRCVLNES